MINEKEYKLQTERFVLFLKYHVNIRGLCNGKGILVEKHIQMEKVQVDGNRR